uniref:Derlin n=1 Tax=Palpitomonas bilix TaxID=652834 RepID=A0A7S3G6G4_9EUKA|mmetsp:Transcript_30624/g.79965  ORF Transcript_30624/g.79965 Transcript_30624/m.79965 type:complete len:397 (+) Transcript_30624:329-1519(+)
MSGSGGPTMAERVAAIPFFTRAVLGTAAGITLAAAFSPDFSASLLNCPVLVVEKLQVWRVVSCTYAPQGLLGLLFGGMFLYNTGRALEEEMGSLYFAVLFASIGFWANILFDVGSLLLSPVMPMMWSPYNCSGGFFVVILGLITIQSQRSTAESMSIWGLFSVPTRYYPVALVLFFSLLGGRVMDNLAGVAIGYLYVHGHLLRLLPSPSKIAEWESGSTMSAVVNLPGYVHANGGWVGAGSVSNADVERGDGGNGQQRGGVFGFGGVSAPPPSSSSGGASGQRATPSAPPPPSAQHGGSNFSGNGYTLGSTAPAGKSRLVNEGTAKSGTIASLDESPATAHPAPSSSSAGGGGGEEQKGDHVRRLMAMGFEESRVVAALAEAGGDFTTAVNLLLQH